MEKVSELPSVPRGKVAFFVLDNKLYICCGTKGNQHISGNLLDEVWEYDLDNDIWTKKNNFSGGLRFKPLSFSLNGKGYLGSGENNSGEYLHDFWQYNPIDDSWILIGEIPEDPHTAYVYINNALIGFSTTTNGFIGFGLYSGDGASGSFWKFNDNPYSWEKITKKPDIIVNEMGFVINENVYVGLGETGSGLPVYQGTQDFYKYDVINNSWIKIGFGGPKRFAAGGFSIGNKGFICGGFHNSEFANLVDLWMFDPTK